MLENKLQANELQEKYPIWLANYTTRTGYQGEYSYWQYAETGRISGVRGNVDSNFRYLYKIFMRKLVFPPTPTQFEKNCLP